MNNETVLAADLDSVRATRVYAERSRAHPRFLAPHWKIILREIRARARETGLDFDLP